MIERLIDKAARELGLDPAELRRRNLVPAAAMPYTNAVRLDLRQRRFRAHMDARARLADHAGFAARRDAARGRGACAGSAWSTRSSEPRPRPRVRRDPLRSVGHRDRARPAHGSGAGPRDDVQAGPADRLGLDPDKIRYLQGDTDLVTFGVGTFGSRSAAIAARALVVAADKLIAKGKRIAAHLLEAAEADIEFDAGRFTIAGTDRSLDLGGGEAAFEPDAPAAGRRARLFRERHFSPEARPFRTAATSARSRSIPTPARRAIVALCVVDDVGTVINPLTARGPDPRRRRPGRRAGAAGAGWSTIPTRASC